MASFPWSGNRAAPGRQERLATARALTRAAFFLTALSLLGVCSGCRSNASPTLLSTPDSVTSLPATPSVLEANARATIIAARATIAAAEAPTAIPSLAPPTSLVATVTPPPAINPPTQSPTATPTPQTQVGCADMLAYVKDGTLWLTDLSGRDRRQVVIFGNRRSIAHPYWLPDGQRLVFTDHESIYFVNVDGSGLRKIDYYLDWPTVSPDGKQIAGTASLTEPIQDLVIMDLDGHNARSLTGCTKVNSCMVNGPTWSSDGGWIAFGGSFGPSWQQDLYVVRSDGSQQRKLGLTLKPPYFPAWSPDGMQIAFVGNYQLYLLTLDGSGPRRLDVLPGAEFLFVPSWSPDGKRLAVSAVFRPGPNTIYVMNADGSDAVAITEGLDPVWRPCSSLRSP